MRLNVSAIQHFSTGDGPGIRTTVFLKGCNLHCPWCHNPETVSSLPVELSYPDKSETNGRIMTVAQVFSEVLEDKSFYGIDGGMTVSGGEPLLQQEPVLELVRLATDNGLPATVIDTAGCVQKSAVIPFLEENVIWYFDVKAAEATDYKKLGGNLENVLENLKTLTENRQNVHVRIPLIPGFNSSAEYSLKMCHAIGSAGATQVDLLLFHRLGAGKYKAMGLEYSYKDISPMPLDEVEAIAKIYKKYFKVNIEK